MAARAGAALRRAVLAAPLLLAGCSTSITSTSSVVVEEVRDRAIDCPDDVADGRTCLEVEIVVTGTVQALENAQVGEGRCDVLGDPGGDRDGVQLLSERFEFVAGETVTWMPQVEGAEAFRSVYAVCEPMAEG